MKSIIAVATTVCALFVASLPGHAASTIHGREYSEGPNCFNIQPHHHFAKTLRFRNKRCSLDVTGMYCLVDTGNGHGTCETGQNHPLLQKTAWGEETALEEFRKEFEKRGNKITLSKDKNKNLRLSFKANLVGVIWSVCYVEEMQNGKCRIKPASRLWREGLKLAESKQDVAPKPAPKPKPEPKPTAPKRDTAQKPEAKPAPPKQDAEQDCQPFFLVDKVCVGGPTKKVLGWIYHTGNAIYALHKVWVVIGGAITALGVIGGIILSMKKRKGKSAK